MSKNDGGPAFPSSGRLLSQKEDGAFPYEMCGMSLRDVFAAQAPSDIPTWFVAFGLTDKEKYFAWRYYYADAMLTEREREK